MRLIISGGRNFFSFAKVRTELIEFLKEHNNPQELTILSGTARGADKCGETVAKHYGIAIEQHPAQWDTYGKSAGFRRNVFMVDRADALLAFWDGKSKGTGHMINVAKSKGLEVKVISI